MLGLNGVVVELACTNDAIDTLLHQINLPIVDAYHQVDIRVTLEAFHAQDVPGFSSRNADDQRGSDQC